MPSVDHSNVVAVIAMTGRFPGAQTLARFWFNLCNGVESTSRFSERELLRSGEDLTTVRSPFYVPVAATLARPTDFDYEFFGMSRADAERTDPQHRVLLLEAWKALEIGGYGDRRSPMATGVFVGSGPPTNDAATAGMNAQATPSASVRDLIGADRDFLATKIAYELNLTGPAVTVQTACSSSLVAVHMACQSLVARDCDSALAGGVAIALPQNRGYLYEPGGIYSRDGRCRPYDADASGTVRGSGAGLVLLKSLDAAIEDNDNILAIIRGTAVNNDGRVKVGFTAPSVRGQVGVIRGAVGKSGVSAAEVSYVEGHGTATPIGDPIEVAALTDAFREDTDERDFCTLGSVKGNIGHLGAASGIAGLIKTVLSVHHGVMPGTLHFETPNPELAIEETPFRIESRTRLWHRPGQRVAGVSSFGLGGTNAHVILSEPPDERRGRESAHRTSHVIALSARSEAALARMEGELGESLGPATDGRALADVAATLNHGRTEFRYRSTLVASDIQTAAVALRAGSLTRKRAFDAPQVALLFSGQGVAVQGTAREAWSEDPDFRAELEEVVAVMQPHLPFDLRDVLVGRMESPGQALSTLVAQPALFALGLALARTWRRWNVSPAALIGHSVGELTAACVSGVFTEEEAALLIARRAALMNAAPEGAMTAVLLGASAAGELLHGSLSLAAVNGVRHSVIAGTLADIEALERTLQRTEVGFRRLNADRAFHSPLIEPALGGFRTCLEGIAISRPQIPFMSNRTGTWADPSAVVTPEYWVEHARQTVLFSDGAASALDAGINVLIEASPGGALQRLIAPLSSTRELTIVQSLAGSKDSLLDAASAVWRAGVSVRIPAPGWRHVPLPTYAFEEDTLELSLREASRGHSAERQVRLNVPSWRRCPLDRGHDDLGDKSWLILGDGWRLGQRIAAAVQEKGGTARVVRLAEEDHLPGDVPATTIQAPTDAEFARVLRDYDQRVAPGRIVHLWSLEAQPDDLDRYFFSVTALARALDSVFPGSRTGLDIVTRDVYDVLGHDARAPGGAMTIAAARVAAQEYPALSWRAIDLDSDERSTDAMGALVSEMAVPLSNDSLALRHGLLWGRFFVPFESPIPAETLIRRNGIYLITGGLGGIGITLARYLHHEADARLILLGRRADDSHAGVRDLRDQGAQVLVVRGDVSSASDVTRAVEGAIETYGGLHGVIHAAGVPGGGIMAQRSRGDAEAVLSPKVRGAQTVADAVETLDLDFVCLCSSLASLGGGAGHADYAAGNAYLDAFAAARTARGRLTVALNWDAWRERGMAVDHAPEFGSVRGPSAHFVDGITDAEGAAAFDAALAATTSQVLISAGDLSRRLQLQFGGPARQSVMPASTTAFSVMSIADERSDSLVHRQIADAWARVLGIHASSPTDDFFTLGGNSLLAMQLSSILRQEHGMSLSLDAIIRAPTIAQLTTLALSQDGPGLETPVAEPGASESQRWRPPPTPSDGRRSARLTPLLCFPWAGGTAGAYRAWQQLGRRHHLDIEPIVYPGREGARRRNADKQMSTLVRHILAEKRTSLHRPYALFGHSFGALVAFEFARLIRDLGPEPPEHLFVSACAPPEIVQAQVTIHDLPDALLAAKLQEIGGTPSDISASGGLSGLVSSTLRADLEVFGTYKYAPSRPLIAPITVFGGVDDASVDATTLHDWSTQTLGECRVVVYPGGHFFNHDFGDAILSQVEDAISGGESG